MAKPLQMMISVEEIAFGKVYRMLDTMPGVAAITILGEGPKTNGAAPRGKQKQGGTGSVYCLLLGAMIETPGISRPQLITVAEANGKKGTSVPDAITKMKKAKHVAVKGSGKASTFTVTAAGKKHFETACKIEGVE
jgi:hypothetical protein